MLRSYEQYISFLVWKAKTFILEGNNMKKLSSFLVLMLIALMLFVSCNGSTPTKEEPAKLEERAATPEDAEIVSALVSSALNAVRENLDGVTRIEDDNTVKFDNVKVINPTTQEVICVLNGTAKYEGTKQLGTLILDLTTGTKYKDKGHTLYAKSSTDGKNIEIVLDGYKLTIPENFLPNINGNTPTVTERATTDSDVEIVSALVYSVLSASQGNIDGVTEENENTIKFENVKINDPSTQEEICILYGTVKIEGTQQSKTLILDLTQGTQYKGKGHTLYARTSSDGQIVEIKLDGYKLTNFENLFSSLNDSISNVLSYLRDVEIIVSLYKAITIAHPVIEGPEDFPIEFNGQEIEIPNTNSTVVLYGRVDADFGSKILTINLINGTKYNNEPHTLYMEIHRETWQNIKLDNEPFELIIF